MQKSFSKYCALAAVIIVLGMPLSAFAAAGSGGSSPDCPSKGDQAKGDQATTAQTCENSKAPGSGGSSGNGN